jgi:hypothetical protein
MVYSSLRSDHWRELPTLVKLEMQCRPRSVWHNLWWRFMPGVEVVVKWPNGWVVLDDDGAGGQTSMESADPDDHYRPLLEKLVGRQAWDWDWRIDNTATDTLRIKFRRRHRVWAAYFAIKWT